MPTPVKSSFLLPPMLPLELLFLLLWTRIQAQAHAYPLQGDQSNDIDPSNGGHFAGQNSGDAIEGRHLHTLPKRTSWRHHDREIITTSPSDTYYNSRRPYRPHRTHYSNDDHNSEQDDGGRTRKYTPNPWSKLTPETWSDTEPSSEWHTEWRSILASAESDGPTAPTDSEHSPSTPTRWLASPDTGTTHTTSGRRRPYPSSTYEASTMYPSTMDPSTIYSIPTSSPASELASESASEIDATTATSPRTARSSSADEASSIMYSDTTYSPLSSTVLFSSSIPSQYTASLQSTSYSATQYSTTQYSATQYSTTQYSTTQLSTTQYSTTQYSLTQYSTTQYSSTQYSTTQYSSTQYSTTQYSTTQSVKVTTTGTSSSSSSSWDIIRPNLSTLHIVANITIHPDVPSHDIGASLSDPSRTPSLDPSNLGVVPSTNVPLGVIIGTVFGIIFGGLALFCILFGINKLRQRKQDSESERRARQLRMGSASTSTLMLARGQEPSGNSPAGSIHTTNEHGEYDRTGILVKDGQEPPAGSGRGWIRFANQRRPSSVPVLPDGNEHSSTPLMQDCNTPSNSHPPRHHFMERSHSPTVPSPLRTNPVTGRDSPSGWI